MSELTDARSEQAFEDYKSAYTPPQAVVEANRCLFCTDAPCISACPTGIDIPQFIRKIATGNTEGSARTIFESNILGMSCARVCPVEVLCVGECVYNTMGVPPVEIGKLQRFATDMAYAQGWSYFEAGTETGKSIGLIGGGPASLSAAHRLRRFGHAVTVYESRDILGGLNTTGVAPYKMRADDSVAEVEWLLGIGDIEVKTSVLVGRDASLDELLERHDAIFLGIGLGPDTLLDLPGAELPGVVGAVDWIERMKLGNLDLEGIDSAVVIGGGNTALDCVRELIGLDIARVTLAYRGREQVMPGYDHEWSAGKKEGVSSLWQATPKAYIGSESIEAVRFQMLDADKQPLEGEEKTLAADIVLLAIGQSKLESLVSGLDGIATDRGKIVVDAARRSGHPKIWAGGDCINGGMEVVNAVADGKLAAESMHDFLCGGA